ncbi:MAG: DMT family transporter, partial [Chitinophagaceae bacterium]
MRKAFWQLHVAIVLAGFTGILGRLITLDEFWLVFWRIGISGLLIWAWVLLSRRRETISGRDRLLVGFNGGIIALHWVAFFGSIKYANVSVALVCFSTVGFFTAILEPLFYRQLPKVTELLLGLMAIVGISLIFHFDPVYKKGIVLGLAAALLGAWFTIQNRRFMQRMNAPTLITWQLTGGGLLMFLLIPIWQQRFSL